MIIVVYAFTMSQTRSIGGARVSTIRQLNKRIESLINKGAEVLSIRVYRELKDDNR